jgi:hypothetical protein
MPARLIVYSLYRQIYFNLNVSHRRWRRQAPGPTVTPTSVHLSSAQISFLSERVRAAKRGMGVEKVDKNRELGRTQKKSVRAPSNLSYSHTSRRTIPRRKVPPVPLPRAPTTPHGTMGTMSIYNNRIRRKALLQPPPRR